MKKGMFYGVGLGPGDPELVTLKALRVLQGVGRIYAVASRQSDRSVSGAVIAALPGITAGSLVLHGRFPYLGYPRRYSREDREAARQAMERTGVAGLEGVPMAHLSGGQRQKVYLAMALAQDTPVLLLDEPTTFLDIAHQLELAETARTLAEEGKAVVMVLHDLNLALSCAHRVAVLEEGQLRRVGAPEEIYASGVLEKVFQVRAHSVETAKGERQYLFSRL